MAKRISGEKSVPKVDRHTHLIDGSSQGARLFERLGDMARQVVGLSTTREAGAVQRPIDALTWINDQAPEVLRKQGAATAGLVHVLGHVRGAVEKYQYFAKLVADSEEFDRKYGKLLPDSEPLMTIHAFDSRDLSLVHFANDVFDSGLLFGYLLAKCDGVLLELDFATRRQKSSRAANHAKARNMTATAKLHRDFIAGEMARQLACGERPNFLAAVNKSVKNFEGTIHEWSVRNVVRHVPNTWTTRRNRVKKPTRRRGRSSK